MLHWAKSYILEHTKMHKKVEKINVRARTATPNFTVPRGTCMTHFYELAISKPSNRVIKFQEMGGSGQRI